MLRAVLTILLLAAWLSKACAVDEPDIVRRFIAEARETCLKAGGKAEPNPTITGLDLDGDGHLDWIVHYDGFCAAAPGVFCGPGGCVLQIFKGWPGPRWTLMLSQSTTAWRADRVRGLPALILTRPSDDCARQKKRVCDEIYLFDRGKMRRAR